MVKVLKINKIAAKKIHDIATYLETEFSFAAAENFVDSTYTAIEKAQKQPTRGRKTNASETVRFLPIDKHRVLFYRHKGSVLYILDLFDTRQNPNKRPFA